MRRSVLLLAGLASFACASDHQLVLKNNSGVPLTLCPVQATPPPPRRVVSSTVVPPPDRYEIDTAGFNPLFWDPVSGRSVLVQMALDDDPAQVLAVVFQHQVPPGDEGGDPALQPTKLSEVLHEVDPDDGNDRIVVRVGPFDAGPTVTILEN